MFDPLFDHTGRMERKMINNLSNQQIWFGNKMAKADYDPFVDCFMSRDKQVAFRARRVVLKNN